MEGTMRSTARSSRLPYVLAIAAALILLAVAVNPWVYILRVPGLNHFHEFGRAIYVNVLGDDVPHVSARTALRKIESVVAFAIVGMLVAISVRRRPNRTIIAIAAVAIFSSGIEVAQKLIDHSTESFAWNIIDVICGALGGLLGSWFYAAVTKLVAMSDHAHTYRAVDRIANETSRARRSIRARANRNSIRKGGSGARRHRNDTAVSIADRRYARGPSGHRPNDDNRRFPVRRNPR